MLLATDVSNHPFNNDFYLAIDTVFPVLILATGLISQYADFAWLFTRGVVGYSFARILRWVGIVAATLIILTGGVGILNSTTALAYRDTSSSSLYLSFVAFLVFVPSVIAAILVAVVSQIEKDYLKNIRGAKASPEESTTDSRE
jgi:hypothetical protein